MKKNRTLVRFFAALACVVLVAACRTRPYHGSASGQIANVDAGDAADAGNDCDSGTRGYGGCELTFCPAGTTRSCYDGAPGNAGVGICARGQQSCAADGSRWSDCEGDVLPGDEAAACKDGLDNDCNGLTDCADPACTPLPICCVPITPSDGIIYAHSSDTLFIVDPSTFALTTVGSFGVTDSMTDLAVAPDGTLYTISEQAVFRVDRGTGQATRLFSLASSNNGLTFLPDGTLLAADQVGALTAIDLTHGTASLIGVFGGGYGSAGDLVSVADGTLYGISDIGGFNSAQDNILLRIDPQTGAATPIGDIGFGEVWGLAYFNSRVLAFTRGGQIIEIDPGTGAGMLLATTTDELYGAGTSPRVPGKACP